MVDILPFSRLTSANLLLALGRSAHFEYDLAEVAASFEAALRSPCFCQAKTPIDDHLKYFFLDEVEEVSQLAEVLWFRRADRGQAFGVAVFRGISRDSTLPFLRLHLL